MNRWEATPEERRAVLESRDPLVTLALLLALLVMAGAFGAALVAG